LLWHDLFAEVETKKTSTMKKTHLYFASFVVITTFGSCGNNSGTPGSSDSTKMNPGDSSVTVTTTTTVTHHKYAGSFLPQPNVKYLDLKTHKEVTVRIDTVRGELVNLETDEPIDLLVEPTKHDTIYGQTGSVVNNYIIKEDNGSYRVDTVRINTVEVHTVVPASSPNEDEKYKEKEKANKTKTKSK
jgi:hypothetical protein